MSVVYYRKQLIDLRAKLKREKEEKKRHNAYYADLIRNSSTPSSKASYRKSKIDRAASHDRTIESIKRQIESAKDSLARARKKK